MSIFDKDPRWRQNEQAPNERLQNAKTYDEARQAIADLIDQVPAAAEKMRRLQQLFDDLENKPDLFKKTRETIRAEFNEGIAATATRIFEDVLAERAGTPDFKQGERVRLIIDGELKTGFIVIIDPKKKLSPDEVEIFHPSSEDDDRKAAAPDFRVAKRNRVVKGAQW